MPLIINRADTSSITDAPGAATETGSGFDTRTSLGVVIGRSLLIGGTYNSYRLDTKRDNVVGGDSGLNETIQVVQSGPMVGWLGDYWKFVFTYLNDGKKTVDTKNFDATGTVYDGTITNRKMTGYQLLVGFNFMISNHISIGPTVVYRNVSYSTQSKDVRTNAIETYGEKDLYSKKVESSLDALISMSFRF